MRPRVEVIYRDAGGVVQRKFLDWQRASTDEALGEWITDYLERLDRGYQPKGYESAPVPHCARVHVQGRVTAEWRPARLPR